MSVEPFTRGLNRYKCREAFGILSRIPLKLYIERASNSPPNKLGLTRQLKLEASFSNLRFLKSRKCYYFIFIFHRKFENIIVIILIL